MKVLDALNYINQHHQAGIAYRSSCRAGQCGSCALKVNGEMALACKKEINDGDKIEPLDFPVIKDLVVDRSEIDGKIKDMGLFLNDECGIAECPSIINPVELENTKKLRSCIDCYSCLSACPVLKVNDEFAGPYFMRDLSKFAMDPEIALIEPKKDLKKDSIVVPPAPNVWKYVPKKLTLSVEQLKN